MKNLVQSGANIMKLGDQVRFLEFGHIDTEIDLR